MRKVTSAQRQVSGDEATQSRVVTVAGQVLLGYTIIEMFHDVLLPPRFALIQLVLAIGLATISGRGLGKRLYVDPWLLLLLSWLVVSITWSLNPEQSTSSLIDQAAPAVSAVILAGMLHTDKLCAALRITIKVGLLLSLLAILEGTGATFSENNLVDPGWRGIFQHKNTFGQFLVVSLATLLVLDHSRWRRVWLGATVALIIGSRSTTALAAAVIALLVYYLARHAGQTLRLHHKDLKFRLFITAFLGGATLFFAYPFVLAFFDKDPTLSSRTDIWTASLKVIRERLWLGYGLDSFISPFAPTEATYAVWNQLSFEAGHGHNALIDGAGQVGLIGIGLGVLLFLRTAQRSLSNAEPLTDLRLWVLLVLFTQAVIGVSEPALLGRWLVLAALLSAVVGRPRPRGFPYTVLAPASRSQEWSQGLRT